MNPYSHPQLHYIPSKFLLRNLTIFNTTEPAFQQVFTKRLYLKNLLDTRENPTGIKESFYKPFKNNKLFKTLKTLELSSISHNYASESLKTSKNIKNLRIHIHAHNNNTKMGNIALAIKRLPVQVQNINLKVTKTGLIDPKNLSRIAKAIKRLPNLQHFERDYQLDTKDYVEEELRAYNQSVSRLENLKMAHYSLGPNEQLGFQKTMKKGIKQPEISGLRVYLSANELPDFAQLQNFFLPDKNDSPIDAFDFDSMNPAQHEAYQILLNSIKKNAESLTNLIQEVNRYLEDSPEDTKFLMQCIMREEIKPFYRFELFSNLKKLEIIQKDCMYPLGSFVVDGFSSLKTLKELKIDIMKRSMGTSYIFKGLLKLPFLQKFSLHITFLKEEDWSFLTQFLQKHKQKQNKLESFDLEIRDDPSNRASYIKQSKHLKALAKLLRKKCKLRSIELKSTLWSLNALSKGLGLYKKRKQRLHTLKIQASDETVICCRKKSNERVFGLCNFLKSQRNSLKIMHISIPFVLEDTTLNLIFKTIGQLTQLRELNISINYSPMHDCSTKVEYFNWHVQFRDGPIKKLRKSKATDKWQPDLASFLPSLENLEDFSFSFEVPDHTEWTKQTWFFEMMRALPQVKRLRKVLIGTASGDSITGEEKKITDAILEMKNIREIDFVLYESCWMGIDIVRKVIAQVNKRQSVKCEFMF